MSIWNGNITTSLYGRRLGLQIMSTAQTGGKVTSDFLVGTDGFREKTSTSPSTASSEVAFGISILVGTSVASTPVFSLDPPIPGVYKTIVFGSTDSALYIKTKNGEYIYGSSLGSSSTTIRSSGGGCVQLVGVTTAIYAAINISSTAVNTVAFQATT